MIRALVILAFMPLISTPAFSDSFDTKDGVTIDYEVKGEGPPLVLLHSGMMSRDDMRVQIDHFSAKYQVIALDSREQGRSSSSPDDISYELMVGDVIGLLDHLKISQASIFGQSDGGITALLSAHLHPERITKLIIHGAVFNFQAYGEDMINGWLSITWDKDDSEARDVSGFPGMSIASYLLGRTDLSGFEDHMQEMARMWATSPNLTTEDLAKIKVPTLVIVGDHFDMPLAHTIEMYEALDNSELFVAPGATHFIHQEKPDLLHKVIEDFLDQ